MSTATRDAISGLVTARSDAALQHLVLEELSWDHDVPAASIGVAVTNGIVMLTGAVSRYSARMAAQRAAHRVEGVLDVVNEIQVKFSPNPIGEDTLIARTVRHSLEADARIPHEDIQVTVSHGSVTLEGSVPDTLARYRAEQAVENLNGVCGVVNKITVTPTPTDEFKIHSAIEQALERRMGQRARRIHVEIKDGVVTLTGTVRSWAESEAAYESAIHAPGVHMVMNRLKVDPHLS